MKLRTILISLLTLAFILDAGCKGDRYQVVEVTKNDTTEIVRILLESSYYGRTVHEKERFFNNNPFSDSIIFKSDSVIVGHIPIGYKIKLLQEAEICSLATQLNSDTSRFPNFLSLKYFIKTDTSYEAAIEDACIVPLFDKNGKQLFGFGMTKQSPNLRCISGHLCGGGLNMKFLKQADTIKAVFQSYWIN